jgi:hypothetical protein
MSTTLTHSFQRSSWRWDAFESWFFEKNHGLSAMMTSIRPALNTFRANSGRRLRHRQNIFGLSGRKDLPILIGLFRGHDLAVANNHFKQDLALGSPLGSKELHFKALYLHFSALQLISVARIWLATTALRAI